MPSMMAISQPERSEAELVYQRLSKRQGYLAHRAENDASGFGHASAAAGEQGLTGMLRSRCPCA